MVAPGESEYNQGYSVCQSPQFALSRYFKPGTSRHIHYKPWNRASVTLCSNNFKDCQHYLGGGGGLRLPYLLAPGLN